MTEPRSDEEVVRESLNFAGYENLGGLRFVAAHSALDRLVRERDEAVAASNTATLGGERSDTCTRFHGTDVLDEVVALKKTIDRLQRENEQLRGHLRWRLPR